MPAGLPEFETFYNCKNRSEVKKCDSTTNSAGLLHREDMSARDGILYDVKMHEQAVRSMLSTRTHSQSFRAIESLLGSELSICLCQLDLSVAAIYRPRPGRPRGDFNRTCFHELCQCKLATNHVFTNKTS